MERRTQSTALAPGPHVLSPILQQHPIPERQQALSKGKTRLAWKQERRSCLRRRERDPTGDADGVEPLRVSAWFTPSPLLCVLLEGQVTAYGAPTPTNLVLGMSSVGKCLGCAFCLSMSGCSGSGDTRCVGADELLGCTGGHGA